MNVKAPDRRTPKSRHNSLNKLSGERSPRSRSIQRLAPLASSGTGRFHLIFIIISGRGNQCKISQPAKWRAWMWAWEMRFDGMGYAGSYAFFNRYRQFGKTFCFCRQLFWTDGFLLVGRGAPSGPSLAFGFVNALDAYDHKLPSKPWP